MKIVNTLYVRDNEWYQKENVYKFGSTANLADRNNTYKTSEIKLGKFIVVYLIKNLTEDEMKQLDKEIMEYFKLLNLWINYDGGKEFFKRNIIDLIEDYLIDMNIEYKKLEKNEIEKLINECEKLNKERNSNKSLLKPYLYQSQDIKKILKHFKTNNKAILNYVCGLGKTLTSLWIGEKLYAKLIVIGVPYTNLINQWNNSIKKINYYNDFNIINFYDKITEQDLCKYSKLLNEDEKIIFITTYSSSYKLKDLLNTNDILIDYLILDEMHHLTQNKENYDIEEEKKDYKEILKIETKKQLGLTATLKTLNNDLKSLKNVISNDDKKYFGEVIVNRGLQFAIKHNYLCNYQIQTLFIDIKNYTELFEFKNYNEKNLFISAFSALKSIALGDSHHLLIYVNSVYNANKVQNYINKLLDLGFFELSELYNKIYTSKINLEDRNKILDNFTKAQYGIIINIYCLGEGIDIPILDGIVIGDNMTSNIRILQSLLRPFRKNIREPNKIAKIIIPLLYKKPDKLLKYLESRENIKYTKIFQVIRYLAENDKNIMDKINIKFTKIIKDENSETGLEIQRNKYIEKEIKNINPDFMKKIKFFILPKDLLYMSYEKTKRIIYNYCKDYNINLRCIADYIELIKKIELNNIYLVENPEEYYGEKFISWIDYLNIDIKDYYTKEEIIKIIKIEKYKKTYFTINTLKKLQEKDIKIPHDDFIIYLYNILNITDLF